MKRKLYSLALALLITCTSAWSVQTTSTTKKKTVAVKKRRVVAKKAVVASAALVATAATSGTTRKPRKRAWVQTWDEPTYKDSVSGDSVDGEDLDVRVAAGGRRRGGNRSE